MRNWLGATLEYFAQSEGDLGVRMDQAVADVFRLGAQRVALIGGDCPALESDRLAMAFARLRPDAGREPDDAVFGPTSDGGNDLLALSRPEPEPLLQHSLEPSEHALGLEAGHVESGSENVRSAL
jgi:glycosyltransferase A (GT-A) superfamily protein (DUF2064 family)